MQGHGHSYIWPWEFQIKFTCTFFRQGHKLYMVLKIFILLFCEPVGPTTIYDQVNIWHWKFKVKINATLTRRKYKDYIYGKC